MIYRWRAFRLSLLIQATVAATWQRHNLPQRIAVDAQILHGCRCDNIGIGRQNKWHGTAATRSRVAHTPMACKRKHDDSAKRTRESEFATATDSPFPGLSRRVCCVHSVLSMLEVQCVWVKRLTRGRHHTSDYNPVVNREHKRTKNYG